MSINSYGMWYKTRTTAITRFVGGSRSVKKVTKELIEGGHCGLATCFVLFFFVSFGNVFLVIKVEDDLGFGSALVAMMVWV